MSEGEQGSPPYPSRPYAWWVVSVLTIAYILSFIDRQVISLMVVPIRRDLGISDTQVSLLIGLALLVRHSSEAKRFLVKLSKRFPSAAAHSAEEKREELSKSG